MCWKDNLVGGMAATCVIEVTIGVILLSIGAALTASYHYQMGLGSQVHSIGGGFIFVAMLYPIASTFCYYGAKYHNKFLLLVHLGCLIGLAVMQMLIAMSGLIVASPDFPYTLQDSCLTNNYLNNQTQAAMCDEYFQSDTFGGLRLAWRKYYTESLADQTSGATMQKLQELNICCGLGPPRHCTNDTRPFPSNRPSTEWTFQQTCPFEKGGDYLPTPLCYAGGVCHFDSPIGSCGMPGAGLFAKGCARALHESLSTTLRNICIFVQSLLVFPILFGCTTLCLMFKRKDEDVLPTGIQITIRPSQTKVYCSRDIANLDRDF